MNDRKTKAIKYINGLKNQCEYMFRITPDQAQVIDELIADGVWLKRSNDVVEIMPDFPTKIEAMEEYFRMFKGVEMKNSVVRC